MRIRSSIRASSSGETGVPASSGRGEAGSAWSSIAASRCAGAPSRATGRGRSSSGSSARSKSSSSPPRRTSFASPSHRAVERRRQRAERLRPRPPLLDGGASLRGSSGSSPGGSNCADGDRRRLARPRMVVEPDRVGDHARELDEARHLVAARRAGRDERHVQEPLVERVGVAEQAALAEVLAVVGADQDERVVELARRRRAPSRVSATQSSSWRIERVVQVAHALERVVRDVELGDADAPDLARASGGGAPPPPRAAGRAGPGRSTASAAGTASGTRSGSRTRSPARRRPRRTSRAAPPPRLPRRRRCARAAHRAPSGHAAAGAWRPSARPGRARCRGTRRSRCRSRSPSRPRRSC